MVWNFTFSFAAIGFGTNENSIRCCRILRHIKIRRDVNPFDPHWRTHFAERKFQKKFGITHQQVGIKPS